MNLRKPTQNRRKRAFTLIELMVVVLILAVLAALVVPRIVGQSETAKRNAAVSDLNSIKNLLASFHLHNSRYPTTEEGLAAFRTPPAGLENTWQKESDREVTVDPWNHDYVYESTEDQYTVTSYGADGAEGGDGNNADIVVSD